MEIESLLASGRKLSGFGVKKIKSKVPILKTIMVAGSVNAAFR